ncbi:hypothetical protein K435DRAFT_873050 [Dendrothele bispora CBS 962.96]|uniref:Uncharacterized protein n=1 Tax=Dendrothele bispora (strain CBS 962.96) TaxID=1314807 RepID=A0A4S8L0B7_DENBC|nr:hypothetical protein K435DRAFT_873050 [Dendrothele bispora CBS 962.96]
MSTVEDKENQQPPSQPSHAETSPKKIIVNKTDTAAPAAATTARATSLRLFGSF